MTLNDIYNGSIPKSFIMLKEEYGIPQDQFWRYLQLRHLINQAVPNPQVIFSSPDILKEILEVFGKGKGASFYYCALLDRLGESTNGLRQAWEADLSQSFSEKEFSLILQNLQKWSREIRTGLIQFKILNRAYWTPTKLHKAGLKADPACLRCKLAPGTLMHLLWSCPKDQRCWTAIHGYIKLIMGHDIPFQPNLYVLGHRAPLSEIPEPHTKWIHTAIMLGRKLLIREWKSEDLLPSGLWFISLSTVVAYEELSYRMTQHLDAYFIRGP